MSSKGGATDAFIQEVNTWKMAGVVAWHASLFTLGAAAWRLLAPPASQHFAAALSASSWFYLLLVYLSTLLVLYAQRRVLTTIDVPPLYVARFRWSGKSWPSLLLSRCLLRQRTLASFGDALLFYLACGVSAGVSLQLLQPPGTLSTGSQVLWVYGAILGLFYGMGHLIRGKNVLSFPILQRHRYFRMKQRLRALAKSTLWLASAALLAHLLISWLLLLPTTWSTSSSSTWPTSILTWPSLASAASAWRSALLVAFAWGAGGHLLEVVFTERVVWAHESDPAPTQPLLDALQQQDPIVQDWCLMDLAAVAEGAAGCSARRAALFADETGAGGWVPLSRYCLMELRHFVSVMASALPTVLSTSSAAAAAQAAAAGGGGSSGGSNGPGGGGVRWNSLQLTAAGGRVVSRQQDLAVWHLQARHYRLTWCLRALSGLTAAGLQLDKYGLLQLSSPNLGDVLGTLLAVVLVVQAFVKHTSAIPSRPSSSLARLLARLTAGSSSGASQQHVDASACALLDVAKTCTYRVTNTYGAVLSSVVAQTPPLVGTQAEAQALLASFLEHQQ